ncbi:MAG: ATP-binding protein [Candidatus Jordarchaeum sp.]|uniref:ATP-binding protein n=1 Tax=Candidatus Jordarchaeum sp. TaxID=2823881 RepID=UPI004049D4CA
MSSTRIIAVSGKGGAGKTVITALMAIVLREVPRLRLLLIDGDPSMSHLARILGLRVERTLEDLRGDVIKVASEGDEEEKGEMVKSLDYYLFEALVEDKGFNLLAMGTPDSPGCFCPANTLLRDAIETLSKNFDMTVVDCEAGLEQINRKVVRSVNRLLIVTDPTLRGLQTADAIRKTADRYTHYQEMGLIINRIRSPAEASKIIKEAATLQLKVLGTVPEDENISKLDTLGKPITEITSDAPSLKAVRKICESLKV